MVAVSVTQFTRLAVDENGAELPIGGGYNGNQLLTSLTAATALTAGTKFVRIATDTVCKVDLYGGSLLLPANSVEYFPAKSAQVLTFSAP